MQLMQCHDIVDRARVDQGYSLLNYGSYGEPIQVKMVEKSKFVNFFLKIFPHKVSLQIKGHPTLGMLLLTWAHWTHYGYEFCIMVDGRATALFMRHWC